MVSCSVQQRQSHTPVTQGIDGFIYLVTGNQMPMKGKPVQRHGKGMVREVWIYQATTVQQVQGQMPLFTSIHTRLAIKVWSDSTGHYQAALPAGMYSVFVKEGELFFASETDGPGIINPVEVVANKVASRNVTVNIGAAY
ncbi:hypothetical protein ACFQ3S_18935 [Mucilaginibacter terrae]|uniref:hypothetical protein n=1 Tax=Mucilaginibacter terrae TaxID=1955052 RepID=UPI003645BEEF